MVHLILYESSQGQIIKKINSRTVKDQCFLVVEKTTSVMVLTMENVPNLFRLILGFLDVFWGESGGIDLVVR